MAGTGDSAAKTQHQSCVSVSRYITVIHVSRRCVYNVTGTLFDMFP